MGRIFLLLSVTWMAGCATPSAEVTPVPVATEDTQPVVVDEHGASTVSDHIVCRNVRRTGTNIREKQCFTREELAEMSQQSRDFFRSRGVRGSAYKPGEAEIEESENKPD